MHRAYAPVARWVILAPGPQAAFMTGAELSGLITSNDGNPLGWLARRRIAGGHGLERSGGVHFGWKKSTATW